MSLESSRLPSGPPSPRGTGYCPQSKPHPRLLILKRGPVRKTPKTTHSPEDTYTPDDTPAGTTAAPIPLSIVTCYGIKPVKPFEIQHRTVTPTPKTTPTPDTDMPDDSPTGATTTPTPEDTACSYINTQIAAGKQLGHFHIYRKITS